MAQNPQVEDYKKVSFFGTRHLQCFLLFCGISVTYALRVNLSVAIVVMTDRGDGTTVPEFAWNEKVMSVILSSFFWGYTITQVPAGYLSRKYGGKSMILYSLLINSFAAIFTPFCARIGNWQLLTALRVLQGLSQGFIYPAAHTLLSNWAPVEERGTLVLYTYTGCQFGTVVMLASSGFLSSAFGWSSIFYISGGATLLWVAAWILWGANSPGEHKTISVEERFMIETSLNEKARKTDDGKHHKVPWVKIFTSGPVLAIVASHAAYSMEFFTLLTQIPIYIRNILGKDIKSNALLSALPYLAMLLFSYVFCAIASFLRPFMRLETSRKLFNTIGMWISAATLIALGYVTKEHSNLAVVLLTSTLALNSAAFLGFVVNHIDLAPNFAGILMGITNTAGNIMSVIGPLIVGFVVTDTQNIYQWRIIFYIVAGFGFFGNLMFIIIGKAELQSWNEPEQTMSSPHELKPLKVEILTKESQI